MTSLFYFTTLHSILFNYTKSRSVHFNVSKHSLKKEQLLWEDKLPHEPDEPRCQHLNNLTYKKNQEENYTHQHFSYL